MSIRVEVDLNLLYRKLCPKCQATMINLTTARLPEEMVANILKGQQPTRTKSKRKSRRKP